jgi:hypothetical protein
MRRSASIVTRNLGASVASRPTPHSASVAPIGIASNRPAAEFRQHHRVVAPQIDQAAFRPGWLVQNRLRSLFEAGRIDATDMEAAEHWLRWAETVGPKHTQVWAARVDRSVVPNDEVMLQRITAATRLREVADALGELRTRILEAVIVRDLPWTELGHLLRLSDKTARHWAAEAIKALAAHLFGGSVPPPPILRYRIEPGRQ